MQLMFDISFFYNMCLLIYKFSYLVMQLQTVRASVQAAEDTITSNSAGKGSADRSGADCINAAHSSSFWLCLAVWSLRTYILCNIMIS